MSGLGPRFERVVAVVEAACALAVVAVATWAGSGSDDWRGRVGWAVVGLAWVDEQEPSGAGEG